MNLRIEELTAMVERLARDRAGSGFGGNSGYPDSHDGYGAPVTTEAAGGGVECAAAAGGAGDKVMGKRRRVEAGGDDGSSRRIVDAAAAIAAAVAGDDSGFIDGASRFPLPVAVKPEPVAIAAASASQDATFGSIPDAGLGAGAGSSGLDMSGAFRGGGGSGNSSGGGSGNSSGGGGLGSAVEGGVSVASFLSDVEVDNMSLSSGFGGSFGSVGYGDGAGGYGTGFGDIELGSFLDPLASFEPLSTPVGGLAAGAFAQDASAAAISASIVAVEEPTAMDADSRSCSPLHCRGGVHCGAEAAEADAGPTTISGSAATSSQTSENAAAVAAATAAEAVSMESNSAAEGAAALPVPAPVAAAVAAADVSPSTEVAMAVAALCAGAGDKVPDLVLSLEGMPAEAQQQLAEGLLALMRGGSAAIAAGAAALAPAAASAVAAAAPAANLLVPRTTRLSPFLDRRNSGGNSGSVSYHADCSDGSSGAGGSRAASMSPLPSDVATRGGTPAIAVPLASAALGAFITRYAHAESLRKELPQSPPVAAPLKHVVEQNA
ncbi:unnamed protein product [Phaeothamnion confervicola]